MVSYGCVEGDALEAMQAAWDERTQFTRSELGGAPDWAQWVDTDGCLFDGIDACDAFNEMLDSTHPPIKVAGVRISPHMALWAQASDYKHKLEGWLLDLVWSGNLRKVVDDGR